MVEPTSAWLFNAIVSKHADAMDSFPEAVILPRSEADRAGREGTVGHRACGAGKDALRAGVVRCVVV